MKNCLICFQSIKKSKFEEYHEACFKGLFGSIKIEPTLLFSRKDFFENRASRDSKTISISGVQPKLALKIIDNKLETTTKGFTHIIKPSPESYPEAAENEHTTMLISNLVGINTAQSGLVRFEGGELVYITKLFDQFSPNEYIHQEDMMQALDVHPAVYANAKYEAKSYEEICKKLKKESSIKVAADLFQRIYFNFMVGNNDYHLKNISIQFIVGFPGGIVLSPHYDSLNVGAFGPLDSEMACSLLETGDGFSEAFNKFGFHTRYCFDELADKIKLPKKIVEKIYRSYLDRYEKIIELVNSSPMSIEHRNKYVDELESRKEKFLKK